VVAGTTVEGAFLPLFARLSYVQPATVVSGTTGEGAALASVRSVGVGTASHFGGGHDNWWLCSGLCSLGPRTFRQPLWWRARQVRALLWPLFFLSAWAQPATVVAGTTVEGAVLPLFARSSYVKPATVVKGVTGEYAALACDLSVGVGSPIHCGGEHEC
jgi:hypothetical protein